MRSFIIGVYLAVTLGLSVLAISCAPLDAFFKKDEVGNSQAGEASKSLTGLPAPWNEIVPGAILLAQNAYLGLREVKRRKTKKSCESKPAAETRSPA